MPTKNFQTRLHRGALWHKTINHFVHVNYQISTRGTLNDQR